MVNNKLRVAASVTGGVMVLSVGGLALNAASAAGSWPGVLDLVRRHPWTTMIVLVPLMVIAVWPADGSTKPPSDRKVVSLATFRLPPRNPNFTGRESALKEIYAAFPAHRSVAVHALHGMGGVGKTQLALEYAYRHVEDYRFIGFIDGERPELVASQFVLLAAELGVRNPVAADQAIDAVCDELTERSPWLLIIDNAGQASEYNDLLPAGRATMAGHIILTTRHRGWNSRGATIHLDVFARQESIAVLSRRIPAIASEDADRLADILGDLPLALAQAAGYLEYSGIPHDEYIRLLSAHLETMIEKGDVTDRPGVAVATLWDMSVHSLHRTHPASVALLQLLACVAPEPFPLDLLTGHSNALDEPLRHVSRDPVSWEDTVGAVVGRSLARRDGSRLIVHRLVQAAIRRQMSEEMRATSQASACRVLVAEAPADVRDHPTRWRRWQFLLPHALAVTEAAVSYASADVATLLRASARCIRNMGDPTTAKPLAERALDIDEACYGPQHVNVAEDLHTLAQIFRDLALPSVAQPLLRRALRIHEASFGPRDRSVGYDLALLALVVRDSGDPGTAQPLIERAIQIDTEIHGPEHGYVADDLSTLARIRHDLGDLAGARSLAERALEIDERLYDPAHTYVGVDITILANILDALGETTRSRELAARALSILEARPGIDYRWTAEDRRLLRRLNTRGPDRTT